MALDSITRKKVEKVEEVPKSTLDSLRDLQDLLSDLPELETIDKEDSEQVEYDEDIDISITRNRAHDEGIRKEHQMQQQQQKEEDENVNDLIEFMNLQTNIKKKYGINYLAKMTKDEEIKYIILYSSVYKTPRAEIVKTIEKEKESLKKSNEQVKETDSLQPQVNRLRADIQDALINSKSLDADEQRNFRRDLDDIMSLSDNLDRVKYLEKLLERVKNKENSLNEPRDIDPRINNLQAEIQDTITSSRYLGANEQEDFRNNLNNLMKLSNNPNQINYLEMLLERVKSREEELNDDMEVSLSSLMPLLQEEGYTIFGHGTGYGNSAAVPSIFENGLRASHTSLFYTTIGLDVQDEESFKQKLDNWPHKESENIVLAKLPNQYFNIIGETMDLGCDRTAAFVNEVTREDGNVDYYLDPKFIIGSYNKNSGKVLLNKKFERVYTAETIRTLEAKAEMARERTIKRNEALSESIVGNTFFDGYDLPELSDLDLEAISSSSKEDFDSFDFVPADSQNLEEVSGPRL